MSTSIKWCFKIVFHIHVYILMNAMKCAKKIVTLQNADERFLFAMHETATQTIIKYHIPIKFQQSDLETKQRHNGL